MGNASSQQIAEEDLPDNLWVTPAAKKHRPAFPSSSQSQPIVPSSTHPPTFPPPSDQPRSAEQKKARKEAKKERKRRQREIASALAEEAAPRGELSPSQAQSSPQQGQPPFEHDRKSTSTKKSHHKHRKSHHSFAMDPNSVIDPSLREAEGTYHTAPVDSNRGQSDRHEYAQSTQAPVAVMNSSASLKEDSYRQLLDPLVQAANQATQQSSESQPFDLLTPLVPLSDQQGKRGKKEGGKLRGRPKKKKDAGNLQEDTAAGAEDHDRSMDGVLGQTGALPSLGQDGEGDMDGVLASEAKKRSKKRRKRDSVENADDQDVAENDEEPQQKRPRTALEPVDEEGLKDKEKQMRESGPLSKLEWKYVDRVIEDFKQENEFDQGKINDLVQSTNRAQSTFTKDLWNRLYDSLPHRQHVAVMRACRRRFNNFEARGKWTPGDDNMLRHAFLEHPSKWVKIGAMLDRMPEDCRDRWRNYLSCGDQRRIDDWTTKEETELANAVHECAAAVKQDAKNKAKEEGHAFREQDWEALVNFNTVSDKMKFTRSRLQCYTHWKVMQNRDPNHEAKLAARRSDGPSNRQGRALANYNKMLPGDKYNIVCQIADTQAQEEEEIPWKQITRQYPQSKWTTRDRKETFAKLKTELTQDQEYQDLPNIINTLLEHFRGRYSEEELALPDPPIDLPGEEAEGQAAPPPDGYQADGPYFTGPQQYANEAQQLMQGDQLHEQTNGGHGRPGSTDALTANVQDADAEQQLTKKARKKPGPKGPRKAKKQKEAEAAAEAQEQRIVEDSEEERRAAVAAEQLGQLAGGSGLTLAHHLYAATALDSNQSGDEPTNDDGDVDTDADRAQDLATLAGNQLRAEASQADGDDLDVRQAGYPVEIAAAHASSDEDIPGPAPKASTKRGGRHKKGGKAAKR